MEYLPAAVQIKIKRICKNITLPCISFRCRIRSSHRFPPAHSCFSYDDILSYFPYFVNLFLAAPSSPQTAVFFYYLFFFVTDTWLSRTFKTGEILNNAGQNSSHNNFQPHPGKHKPFHSRPLRNRAYTGPYHTREHHWG